MRPVLLRLACPLLATAALIAALPVAPARAQVSPPRPDIPPAEGPSPAPSAELPRARGDEAEAEEAPPPAPADDPTHTAGGALRKFMASRDYRSIRELKSVMTPRLVARYDQDSVPFNGKRSIRLAAFDFTEQDLKPVAAKPAQGAAVGRGTTAQAAVGAAAPEAAYVATVRGLWEEQGEAVEMRVESLRIARQENGLWRVGTLERVRSEPLRFKDPIAGVTSLRMIMRAWHRRDLQAARTLMSQPFLKKYEGREEALQEIFVGRGAPRHAAYQILEVTQQGNSTEIARVKLFETVPGQPGPLDGPVRTLKLVKIGPRWLLGTWD